MGNRRLVNYEKMLDLRFALANGFKQKNLIPDWRDETLLSRPAKKKKRKKPQKMKVEIEDVSDGKL